jgi:lysophospholipase L1-like esterase
MKMTRAVQVLLALIIFVGAASAQQGDFYLKNGDRVVFYGDSITDQRLYTAFVETYVVTRWPELDVTFIHSGWSGDRVTGGRGGTIDLRLRRDVIAYRPTVVTLMLGMNDGNVKPYDPALFQTYATGYRHIIKTLKEALPNLRITLIKPSPYDDVTRPPTFDGGYNSVLARYGNFVGELAQQMKLDVADLNTPVVAALTRANSMDSSLATKIIPDRVHPGPGGHLVMAQALLRAWNAPAIVTSVEIDAAARRVVKAENSRVSNIVNEGGISWTQLDRALPMPFDMKDPALALAVQSSDVIGTLNQQLLKVNGLAAPRYALKIDGEVVGTFTRESLSAGINLSTLQTPMLKQALEVHSLTLKHNNIHFAWWREVQVPLQDENLSAVQKALNALGILESELVRKQRAMARPKPHRLQLIPQV